MAVLEIGHEQVVLKSSGYLDEWLNPHYNIGTESLTFAWQAPAGAVLTGATLSFYFSEFNGTLYLNDEVTYYKTYGSKTANVAHRISLASGSATMQFSARIDGVASGYTNRTSTTVSQIALRLEYMLPDTEWTLAGAAEAGSTAAITISAAAEGASHEIWAVMGSLESTHQSIAAGAASAQLTIPDAWNTSISSGVAGTTGTVYLKSVKSGAQLYQGSKTLKLVRRCDWTAQGTVAAGASAQVTVTGSGASTVHEAWVEMGALSGTHVTLGAGTGSALVPVPESWDSSIPTGGQAGTVRMRSKEGSVVVSEKSRAITLLKKSQWTVTASVEAGGNATITLERAESGITHEAWITMGNEATAHVTMASGVAAAQVTVPLAWSASISTSAGTSAVAHLKVLQNGTELREETRTIRILPSSALVPSVSVTLSCHTVVDGQTYGSAVDGNGNALYLAGHCCLRIQASGSAATGSSIARMGVTAVWTGGNESVFSYEGAVSALDTVTQPLMRAGTVRVSVWAEDNVGRRGAVERSVTVHAYTEPRFDGVNVFRCDAQGQEDSHGRYCYVDVKWQHDQTGVLASGAFVLTAAMEENLWTTSTGTLRINERATPELETYRPYRIDLTIGDGVVQKSMQVKIQGMKLLLYFNQTGNGVSIGTGESHANALTVNDDWEIYYRGRTLAEWLGIE